MRCYAASRGGSIRLTYFAKLSEQRGCLRDDAIAKHAPFRRRVQWEFDQLTHASLGPLDQPSREAWNAQGRCDAELQRSRCRFASSSQPSKSNAAALPAHSGFEHENGPPRLLRRAVAVSKVFLIRPASVRRVLRLYFASCR
jgi:hypothetical protein